MKIVSWLFTDWSRFLAISFLVLFSFGQLQRVQLSGNIAFYLHDLVILVFLLTAGNNRGQANWFFNPTKIKNSTNQFLKLFTRKNLLELTWLGWLLGGVILGTMAGRLEPKSFLYLFRLAFYLLFLFKLSRTKLGFSPRTGFMVAGIGVACWGLLQYLFLPDTRFLNIFGWDNHYYRLISTLFDPAFTGMILVLTLGFWLEFKTNLLGKNLKSNKLASIVKSSISSLLIVAIAASFSRASFISLAVVLVFNLIFKPAKKHIVWLIALFIITLLLLPKPGGEGVNLTRTSTAEARLINAQENLITLKGGQWLWGRGLFNNDAFKVSYTHQHANLPDSWPIMMLNSTGIAGTALTLLVITKWGKYWWRVDPAWTSLLLATLIHGLFNNTLLQPFVFLMLWGGKINREDRS